MRPHTIHDCCLQRHSGFVGIAADLISFDAQYKNVFANLLGRVIVAEDMDAAIAIARAYHHRYRIVTLDGQVLNAGGSMTGGSVSRSAGILSRGNELARLRAQIDGVQARLKEANQTKADAQREVDAATYELEVAQNQRHELDAQVLQLRGELGQYEVLLDGLRRSMEASQEEQAALAQRMSRTETDTDAARARITQLEGESEALRIETEGKTAGESALKENQNAISSAISELSVELAALDAEEGALRQAIEELCSLRSGLSLDQDQRREQLIDSAKREEELNALMTDQQQALAQRREQRDQRERAMRAVTQARLQTEAQRTRADRDAREKIEELLKLERVCARLEQKKTSAVMEEKQLLDKLWDTYELSHSEAEKQRQSLESMQKATRRIAELKRAINALGAVNVGAIDDYKRINERYTYLVEQRADVEQSKAELEGIISKITDQMREIFAEQFELISRSFSETFRELFRGGRASLELEDKDDILNCGIEIKVQPPVKSLKIISLLSGCEKAFVAIALYFSILKVRPTPFVVLDEIEAALDDNNVVRFARYMRGMTDHTQFIVITHRRGTMEESDVLYGVTMQEQGISRILTINLNEVEKQLHIK